MEADDLMSLIDSVDDPTDEWELPGRPDDDSEEDSDPWEDDV